MVWRLLFLVLEHMFNDYFALEPARSLGAGMFAFRECATVLGYKFNTEKSQSPAELFECLGVLHDYSAIIRANKIFVCATPSRELNLHTMMERAEATDELLPSSSRKFVGKFGFYCETLFGRVGRVAQGALRARQYQAEGPYMVTMQIGIAFDLIRHFIDVAPARTLDLALQGRAADHPLYGRV